MTVSLKNIGLRIFSNRILKNIPIFHLILLVIAVMLIFLMIQGYLSLKNIDTMQQVNQRMFDTSMQFMKEISTLKQNLFFVRENYLKRLLGLADTSSINYTFRNIDASLQNIERIAQDTSMVDTGLRAQLKNLGKDIGNLKKSAYAPDTTEDFWKFDTTYTEVMGKIGPIQVLIEGISYSTSVFSKHNSQNQKTMVVLILIVSAFIAVIIALFINASVSWPLREIVKAARSMSSGDFRQNIHSFGCKEASEVVQELNASLNSLRFLIGNINRESERIAKASEELKTVAKESGHTAEEMARAMEELTQAAQNQTDQVTQSARIFDKLGDTVRRVSQETLNIANTSEQVAEFAKNGQKVTHDVAGEINDIYLSAQAISVVMQEFNEATKDIFEITKEIQEIADQTSLLTLNASIEAARAGEHGRGFSVVANETGKLADRCREAARTIADRVAQIIEKAEYAVELMEQGAAQVEEGKKMAGQATVTFGDIFNRLKTMLTRINGVANSAKEMNRYNEEASNAVSNIAAISEESLAGTQEISASAEQQSASAQEVTAQAEKLLLISNEIKQAAGIFKI